MGVGNEIAVDSWQDQQPTKHLGVVLRRLRRPHRFTSEPIRDLFQASVIVNGRGNTLVLVASRRNASKALQGNPTRVVPLS
jgi:hypothetical protein